MEFRLRQIQHFIYSQAFADGLKATLAILVPALIGVYSNQFQIGFAAALGAMVASLTDAPGPIVHKKNGILLSVFFAFLVALYTPLVQHSFVLMLMSIAAVTFFFSMFMVYGNRASAVGNTAILILILTMDKPVAPGTIWQHAGLIAAGGLFYLALSWAFYSIQPYRIAQRSLGDCITEVARYLDIRADFYNTQVNLEQNYKRLVAQQVVVNEKQDVVREIFFKTRRIVEESTDESRRLVFCFVQTVDLFEDITASYYHYATLREQYGSTGALELFHAALKKIVYELESIALAIESNSQFTPSFHYDEAVKQLKACIDGLPLEDSAQRWVLKKIVVNIRNLLTGLMDVSRYFDKNASFKKSGVDHSHFISHQPLHPRILLDNLSLHSSVFRHSIRVCVACVLGYTIARFLNYGQYSYWILLTIAFILKPAFSLTKQRNIERIIGTAIGGGIGFLLLYFISSGTALFVLMVLFMIGAYSFMRINYFVMVLCITPYVLILFSFFGAGFQDVIKERMIDTVIGCAIAFPVSYLLFPKWEREQLQEFMLGILKANLGYLQKIMEALSGLEVSMLDYKLARKNVYLQSANLSAAFQRMLSEPKSKQSNASFVQEFVVLNHLLFSNIATLATTLLGKDRKKYSDELIHTAKRTEQKLQESIQCLDKNDPKQEFVLPAGGTAETDKDEKALKEQLSFVEKLSTDIYKATKNIIGK